jgi:hypothetical protein
MFRGDFAAIREGYWPRWNSGAFDLPRRARFSVAAPYFLLNCKLAIFAEAYAPHCHAPQV